MREKKDECNYSLEQPLSQNCLKTVTSFSRQRNETNLIHFSNVCPSSSPAPPRLERAELSMHNAMPYYPIKVLEKWSLKKAKQKRTCLQNREKSI